MKFLLVALSSLLATSLALGNPTEILSTSSCNYVASTDTVDCSAVTSTEEIMVAMAELAATGHTDIAEFLLLGNSQLSHLPQGMLGEVRFNHITINGNWMLTSCGDILGASKSTVLTMDLSNNKLSYLPRMESSSLLTYKQNGPFLTTVASNALNAVPNLQVIELKETGQTQIGLFITEGTFENLPMLQELNMTDYKAKDDLATKGSFTFNSPHLHTVDLRSNYPIYNAEVGTFGGFNANTTLWVKLNAVIGIESFYNVFNSGSHVVVQELQPCGCNLDWIRFSCFLPQASIRCVYRQDFMEIQGVPEDNFARCCFGK